MNMEHLEEDMVLDDDDEKYDDVIDEEEVDCKGVRQSSRDIRPVDRLEPYSENEKSYLQFRKEKKISFDDDITNMKTQVNHSLLAKIIEKNKRMEYSKKEVKLIARVIEYSRNNTMGKNHKLCTKLFSA